MVDSVPRDLRLRRPTRSGKDSSSSFSTSAPERSLSKTPARVSLLLWPPALRMFLSVRPSSRRGSILDSRSRSWGRLACRWELAWRDASANLKRYLPGAESQIWPIRWPASPVLYRLGLGVFGELSRVPQLLLHPSMSRFNPGLATRRHVAYIP